jgi:hypothetical protein
MWSNEKDNNFFHLFLGWGGSVAGLLFGWACHNNKSNFHFFLFMVGKAKVDRQRAATGLDWTGLQGIGDFQAFFMCIFG